MLILGIITGLIILVILIVVHELGHAIVARRNGVTVEEFGIGFPPRAWGKRLKNGVLFSLNWLPLGGFVRLKGEHDAATGKGSYGAASFWQKTKILLAGVAVNWLVAAVLLTLLALIGLPKIIPNQFIIPADAQIERSAVTLGGVVDGGAAASAGLAAGDEIVSVADVPIETTKDFTTATEQRQGEMTTITYRRGGEQQTVSLTLGTDRSRGIVGVQIGQNETIRATWSAPIVGVGTTVQLTGETLTGLGRTLGLFVSGLIGQLSGSETTREQARQDIGEVSESVAGPVGILGVIFPAVQQQGWERLILLTAIISLTLAVMNALPIPMLDGGRWWTMVIFRVLRRKLTREREETIQTIGFLLLMGLIVLITISDIGKLW